MLPLAPRLPHRRAVGLLQELPALARDLLHLRLRRQHRRGLGLELRECRLLRLLELGRRILGGGAHLQRDLGLLLRHLGVHLERRRVPRLGGDFRLLRAHLRVVVHRGSDGVHIDHVGDVENLVAAVAAARRGGANADGLGAAAVRGGERGDRVGCSPTRGGGAGAGLAARGRGHGKEAQHLVVDKK